jgi:hypothetical protein
LTAALVDGVRASGCKRGSAAATAAGPIPALHCDVGTQGRSGGGQDFGDIGRQGRADNAQRRRGELDHDERVVIVDPQCISIETAVHRVASLQCGHDCPHRTKQLGGPSGRFELAQRLTRPSIERHQHGIRWELGNRYQTRRRNAVGVGFQRAERLVFHAGTKRPERSVLADISESHGAIHPNWKQRRPRIAADDLHEQLLAVVEADPEPGETAKSSELFDGRNPVPESFQYLADRDGSRSHVRSSEDQLHQCCSRGGRRDRSDDRRRIGQADAESRHDAERQNDSPDAPPTAGPMSAVDKHPRSDDAEVDGGRERSADAVATELRAGVDRNHTTTAVPMRHQWKRCGADKLGHCDQTSDAHDSREEHSADTSETTERQLAEQPENRRDQEADLAGTHDSGHEPPRSTTEEVAETGRETTRRDAQQRQVHESEQHEGSDEPDRCHR